MPAWLSAAIDYVPRWLELQLRQHEQPGCALAVAHRGRIVLEAAFGHADLVTRERLTPLHRFRAASHSKTFAAAALMKLKERRRLRLDDPVGRYVGGLHPRLAGVSIAQVLSHGAGVVRDGPDSGQFVDRRPFLDERELRMQLRAPPVLAPSTRFKYSNHGYGLLGLVVEAVAEEAYVSWMQREVIEAAGLGDTLADGPPPARMPLASGHSGTLPLGRRAVIPGRYSTHALAPAAGVVSTARDLVGFFQQLSPRAQRSLLSPASRREMLRRRWRDPHSSIERHYGLGAMSGSFAGWPWFGHSGGLQGYITRTCVLPAQELALSVLTNAVDGLAHAWLEGTVHILRTFSERGAPSRRLRGGAGAGGRCGIPSTSYPWASGCSSPGPICPTPFWTRAKSKCMGRATDASPSPAAMPATASRPASSAGGAPASRCASAARATARSAASRARWRGGIKSPTMLELRPTCEHCNKALPPASTEARICSYECTFCAACVDTVLLNVCPNCGGGFVPRPIRPSRDWKGGNYLGKDAASSKVKHRPVEPQAHARFSAAIREIPPEKR